MMGRTHILFGMSCWAGLEMAAGVPHSVGSVVSCAIAGAGALLPDIDHPGSIVGKRLFFISLPLSAVIGHRGVTHSAIGVAAVIAGLLYYGLDAYVWPLGVGYLSHVAGDMATPSGCPLLWPSKRPFSLKLWQTGSWVEGVLVAVMMFWLLFSQTGIGPLDLVELVHREL